MTTLETIDLENPNHDFAHCVMEMEEVSLDEQITPSDTTSLKTIVIEDEEQKESRWTRCRRYLRGLKCKKSCGESFRSEGWCYGIILVLTLICLIVSIIGFAMMINIYNSKVVQPGIIVFGVFLILTLAGSVVLSQVRN